MKWFGNISLRTRITLLTGVAILLTSALLALTTTYNAGNYFQQLTGELTATMQPLDDIQYVEVASTSALAVDSRFSDTVASIEPLQMSKGVQAAVLTVQVNRKFNLSSYVITVIVACAGMAACWFLAGRALSPVRRLSETAVKISANNLNSRIPHGQAKDEIGELTGAFNGMLDRLEESFQRQKRFSSNVAHELKTPLATLKMSLQVGRMEYGEEECGEIFAVAERSVDRLAKLVDDLTNLTNQSALDMNDLIPLCGMLRGIACELGPVYEGKGLTVEYALPEPDTMICGNRELVRRIFYNLVENAMKYNEPGGKLCIGVRREAAAGGGQEKVLVTVSDSGSGIDHEALERIFEPFYCVDPSRSRKLGGAGLGLSIVKEAAERHGWNIAVESVRGEGTSFVVEIPKGA